MQRLIDLALSGLTYVMCLAYIDDIIVYARSLEEHFERLCIVLSRICQAGLKVKPSKTALLQKSVGFLGHLVSAAGVQAHPEKTKQILDWGVPRCLRDVRAFIGISSYYRKYINGYARTAAPLTALLSKGRAFEWTQECQHAFDELKRALTNPPILALPQDNCQYILDTDSSAFAIGAVLSQVQDGETRVIAYASKHLSTREQNYCVTRRELLAVVHYLKYFRQYLLGANPPFKVRTDHAAILWLRRIPEPVGQQARWLEIMESYNFVVEHRAGARHGNADAMSRDPCHNRLCCPMTADDQGCGHSGNDNDVDGVTSSDGGLNTCAIRTNRTSKTGLGSSDCELNTNIVGDDDLRDKQLADKDIAPIYRMVESAQNRPDWDVVAPLSETAKTLWRQFDRLVIRNGVLMRRFEKADGQSHVWQIIMPRAVRSDFLTAVHAGVAGGHFGRRRTESAVQARAYWPGWADDVKYVLRTCVACAQYARSKPTRRVGLSTVACGEPFEILALDITGPHPTSSAGHNYILTMQDLFTRWTEAFAILRHTAPVIARILFDQVFMRFGTPLRILTDQGPEFESQLIQQLCNFMGVEKIRTTPYLPRCNGQLERFHRSLNAMLGKIVAEHQRDWHLHLPTVMAAYRASSHETTGYTPNKLFLGREARLPVDLAYGVTPSETGRVLHEFFNEMSERMAKDFETVRDHVNKAVRVRQKRYDVRVTPQELVVGQQVWYLCPRRYRNRSPKWQRCFTGPYTIVNIVDPHVYIIKRHSKSKSFAVHRDKLKPAIHGSVNQNLGASAQTNTNARSSEVPLDMEDVSDVETRPIRPSRACRRPIRLSDYKCFHIFSGEVAMTPKRVDPALCAVCGTTVCRPSDLRRHQRTRSHAVLANGERVPAISRRSLATKAVFDGRAVADMKQSKVNASVDVIGKRRPEVRLCRCDELSEANTAARRTAENNPSTSRDRAPEELRMPNPEERCDSVIPDLHIRSIRCLFDAMDDADLVRSVRPDEQSVRNQVSSTLESTESPPSVAVVKSVAVPSDAGGDKHPGSSVMRQNQRLIAQEQNVIHSLPVIHTWLCSAKSISAGFAQHLATGIDTPLVAEVIASLSQHASESGRIADVIAKGMTDRAAEVQRADFMDADMLRPNSVSSSVCNAADVMLSSANVPSSFSASPSLDCECGMNADTMFNRLFEPASSSDGCEEL
jgi:transposase InsO family protein